MKNNKFFIYRKLGIFCLLNQRKVDTFLGPENLHFRGFLEIEEEI
ncbi:MAG: hypothetical protein NT076_01715 [Candidatus Pacearchaeota archaeon]|nr:hypothetical protein [Candidatus Pacearchaeota archaeon]